MALKYGPKLPQLVQPYLKLAYIFLHFCIFVTGLVYSCLGPYGQAVMLLLSYWSTFWNGGRYYIDYFWKVYETNALLYHEPSAVEVGVAAGADKLSSTCVPDVSKTASRLRSSSGRRKRSESDDSHRG